jgi:hypothetical protein
MGTSLNCPRRPVLSIILAALITILGQRVVVSDSWWWSDAY